MLKNMLLVLLSVVKFLIISLIISLFSPVSLFLSILHIFSFCCFKYTPCYSSHFSMSLFGVNSMQDILFCHFPSIPGLISVVSFINTLRLSLKLYSSFFLFLLQRSEFPECLSVSFTGSHSSSILELF